jgi:hypothetical protein
MDFVMSREKKLSRDFTAYDQNSGTNIAMAAPE